jgi:hypothetical protein
MESLFLSLHWQISNVVKLQYYYLFCFIQHSKIRHYLNLLCPSLLLKSLVVGAEVLQPRGFYWMGVSEGEGLYGGRTHPRGGNMLIQIQQNAKS